MDPSSITFVILTRDEEGAIADCLGSLPAASAALVYDAQSRDRTREVAASLGARVYVVPWHGFEVARAAAGLLVKTEWVFVLDADERVSTSLREELLALETRPDIDAYTVPRANHFCGRWIRGAAWWPDRQVRLYRRGRAKLTASDPRKRAGGHVYFSAPGRTADLDGHVIHYSYASIDDYRRRFKRYTDSEASAGPATFREAAAAWLVMPLRAAWLLVVRRGLLDGWRGVYVSIASALYPAVVATKAWRGGR